MFAKRSRKHKQEIIEKSGSNIFTIGVYHGILESPWILKVENIPFSRIVSYVTERSDADGQWCIDMDLVGNNEDRMRQLMAYVCDPENIKRNVEYQIEKNTGVTLDFVCRDLANGSRWAS